MSWPPEMKLVLVEWIDSNGAGGWHQYDDMLATVQKGMGCRSVGWLLLDEDDRISLVPNLAETGSVADATTIPRSAVLSIVDLVTPSGPGEVRNGRAQSHKRSTRAAS